VFGDDRLRLLLDADLFVLPSHSENYGMVWQRRWPAEGPSSRHGHPWSSLTNEGCGWWWSLDPSSRGALRRLFALDAAAPGDGDEARLVEREHSIRTTAGRMEAVYEWVRGRGPQPECVAP
jgi:glycosyltransferase involved in cell wall biosynthesis